MEVVIRPIRTEDAPALAKIEAESFSMPWRAEDFAELTGLDYACYLVAEVDGEPVGTAGMRIVCDEGDIDNVVVREDMRGNGLAGKLIAELLLEGERRGVKEFTLEVRESNAAAIAVYERAGFVYEGTRPHFYEKPTEDARIYWKRG